MAQRIELEGTTARDGNPDPPGDQRFDAFARRDAKMLSVHVTENNTDKGTTVGDRAEIALPTAYGSLVVTIQPDGTCRLDQLNRDGCAMTITEIIDLHDHAGLRVVARPVAETVTPEKPDGN